ncbi:putative monooxygenase [Mycena galopus ATCC 62051]|nr:putative monooxygenase [Mycena galopus ATCC 62051]
MSGSSAVLVVAVVSVGYLLSRAFHHLKSNLPPGPQRWPLIGSALAVPQVHQWVTFSQWAKTYGNIIYLNALGQPIIVINSAKIANELLDQRSSIYSERPIMIWRQQRKIVAHEFGPSAVPQYYAFQEAETRKLVHGLVKDSSTLTRQIQLTVGTIIIRVTYGHYVTGEQDPFLTTPLAAMETFSQASAPGMWAVDFLPFLANIPSWLPGTGFQKTAKQWNKLVMDTSWNPYLWCKGNLALGSGKVLLPNLCANYLEALDGKVSDEQESRLVWASSAVLGGGLDTASDLNTSSILTFIFAMMLNQDVQAKAREELDGVVGPDRLPVLQDRASLPYVRSMMTEVFRWQPAIPLGVPHGLRQDDIYDGMHLPKNSVIIPNVWHMLHDPEVYPNPMEFDPDRYHGLDSEMAKVTNISFGFGRRACPGKEFAEGTFFAFVATVLATCEILPILDAEGKPVVPDVSYSSGTIVFPSPFDCNVKCRSPMALDLLAHGYSGEGET